MDHETKFLNLRRTKGNEKDPIMGIGLSGGGIRSATFNLGVMTVLEKAGFMKLADYLSTVSGGGYAGAYFLGNRLAGQDLTDDSSSNASLGHLRRFGNYLTPSVGAMSTDTWTMIMIWFRNTSMLQLFLLSVFAVVLLTPRLWGMFLEGILAPEWKALRSLAVPASILNFHAVVAGICIVLIDSFSPEALRQTRALAPAASAPPKSRFRWMTAVVIVLALAGCTSFAIGAFDAFASGGAAMTDLNLQYALTLGSCGYYLALFSLGYGQGFRGRWGWEKALYLLSFVVGSTIICGFGFEHVATRWGVVAESAGLAIVLTLWGRWAIFASLADEVGVTDEEKAKRRTERRLNIGRSVAAALACGATSYIGLTLAEMLLGGVAQRASVVLPENSASVDLWLYALFAAPGLLINLATCIIVLIAFAGRAMPDLVREGWSRLGALNYLCGAGLLGVGLIGVYGPLVILTAWTNWNSYVLASGGFATAIVGALSLFAANAGETSGKKAGGPSLKEILAKVGPPLFIALLFCTVAMALHMALIGAALSTEGGAEGVPSQPNFEYPHYSETVGGRAEFQHGKPFLHRANGKGGFWNGPDWPPPEDLTTFHWQFLAHSIKGQGPLLIALFAALLVLAILLASRLDINEFSIGRFYRNRLARCFIGARRSAERRPNPFTGFDDLDDVDMSEVRQHLEREYLDKVVSTPIPLINTALNAVGGADAAMAERRAESFCFTPWVASSRSTGPISMQRLSTGRLVGDVTLGSLIAISGAAASPNMGFHTSPTIAFLLTFFNLRLGWWVGVPKLANWWKRQFNLLYVFFELFGTADTNDAYVNLSDGGHFDNLGLYELVRRKCRLIIIGDGEQDEPYVFESLGMAIRRCRIDFNVEIEIDVSPIRPESPGAANGRCWAIGKIYYRQEDCNDVGYLVYLKSSFTGKEPYDVQQYRYQHPEFPQQPTADQNFNESQFESYRQLGKFAASGVLGVLGHQHLNRKSWVDAAERAHSTGGRALELDV